MVAREDGPVNASERRVALVTGASRGIGAAVAERLATDGFDLVVAARSEEQLGELGRRLAAGAAGRIIPVPVDLLEEGGPEHLVEQVAARVGRVDVLVNNAGLLHTAARVEELSPTEWARTFRLNVEVPFLLCRALRPLLPPGSAVVNISSTAARYPSVGLAAYCASKAALEMLTKVLALEWARDGVRVVTVMPGKVQTDMVEPILRYAERRQQSLNPLGRVGRPEEVAGLVAYLVGTDAAYLTGSTHVVDGGELLRHES